MTKTTADHWKDPEMTRKEFLGRLRAFVEVYPELDQDTSGISTAAAEIIAHETRWDQPQDGTIKGTEWAMGRNAQHLSKDAMMLGAAILNGDTSSDPDWMELDITGVPEHYRTPMQHFWEQFVWIMSGGKGKGYRIWNSMGPEGWGWLSREIVNKIGEAKGDLENGDTEHAGKVLAKIATSAFCIYTAYTWYTNLPKWYEDGYLDERAIQLLDETDPEEV